MENTVKVSTPQPLHIQTPREFVERTLGFGAAVEHATLASLFEATAATHYGSRKGNEYASLNAVSREQWDKIHFTDSGAVLHDILSNPMHAVMGFIKKEMAKKGFSVDMESMNPGPNQKLAQIVRLVQGFYTNYIDRVAAGTKLLTSISLRQHEDTINYDMVFRVGMFTPSGETMYLEYFFPQMVKNVALLITEEQVSEAVHAVRGYLQNFGQYAATFREIAGLEISRLIVHEVIQKRDITTVAAYTQYFNLVQLNKHHLRNREDVVRATKVVQWDELLKVQRVMLIHAIDLARVQISGFIAFNVEEASM